jgi:hypothetical protein
MLPEIDGLSKDTVVTSWMAKYDALMKGIPNVNKACALVLIIINGYIFSFAQRKMQEGQVKGQQQQCWEMRL